MKKKPKPQGFVIRVDGLSNGEWSYFFGSDGYMDRIPKNWTIIFAMSAKFDGALGCFRHNSHFFF